MAVALAALGPAVDQAQAWPSWWPYHEISYSAAKGKPRKLAGKATRAWNRVQDDYLFVRATSKAEAQLRIRKGKGGPFCHAQQSDPYPPKLQGQVKLPGCANKAVAMHELGHVLGLGHQGLKPGCHLMSPAIKDRCAPKRPRREDRRRVRKLAAKRDQARAEAPQEASLTLAADPYPEEPRSYDIVSTLRASWDAPYWPAYAITMSDPEIGFHCEDGPDEAEGFGPFGRFRGPWVQEYSFCGDIFPPGQHTITATARSLSGVTVADELTFTVP